MRRYVCVPAVLAAGIGSVCLPSAAMGGAETFQIVWHDVDISRDGRTAAFTLAFNRAPSFTVDADLMPGEAFQYEIDADADHFDLPLSFDDIDTVVRGSEIRAGDSALPVRERDGAGGPDSGGWGAVRALLPFELDDRTLTFTAPLSAIGDNDGRFRYRLISTEEGSLTSENWSAVVPLPMGAWPGIVMLGALAAARVLRTTRR